MPWPITAADLRHELEYKPTEGSTEELTFYANAACERIEDKIGPVSGQMLEAHGSGPASAVPFGHRVARLHSVTVDGVALPVGDFTVDHVGTARGAFPAGVIVVRAVAPLTTSSVVILAARRLAALWWKQSKNGPRSADPDAATGIMGVGMPRAVEAMLLERPSLPGIA